MRTTPAVEPHRAPEPVAVKPEPEIEEIGAADYEAHLPEAAAHLKDIEPEPEPEVRPPASPSLPPVVVRSCSARSLKHRRRRRRRGLVTAPIACARRKRRSAARST